MFTAKTVRQKSIYIINRFLNYNAHAQKENRHIGKRYPISKERKINMANGGLETQRRHTLTALANYPTRLPKNTDNHTVRITKHATLAIITSQNAHSFKSLSHSNLNNSRVSGLLT